MAGAIQISKTLATADDNGISLSQTPLAGGNLTINGALASGGVASLDTQRRVIITSAGDDSGRTFTVYGTDDGGHAISQAVTGANAGAATTTLDFKTVTRIAVDAATAGAVIAGTNGVGATPWINLDTLLNPFNLGIGAVVTGTINFSAQFTYDNPSDPFTATLPTAFAPTAWASKTATQEGAITIPARAMRLLVNSGDGTVKLIALQAGQAS